MHCGMYSLSGLLPVKVTTQTVRTPLKPLIWLRSAIGMRTCFLESVWGFHGKSLLTFMKNPEGKATDK